MFEWLEESSSYLSFKKGIVDSPKADLTSIPLPLQQYTDLHYKHAGFLQRELRALMEEICSFSLGPSCRYLYTRVEK